MAADVSSTLKTWTTAESGNAPSGSVVIGTNLDDNLRMIQSVVRYTQSRGTIVSAATCDIGSVENGSMDVTGTTTITSFGTVDAGIRKILTFTGALTLTHNSTSLKLPGSVNITTVAGDVAVMESLGSGNWKCLIYSKVNGNPVSAIQLLPDGTVGAPALAFTNETTMGIYRPSSGKFAITVDGTNRHLVVDSSNTRIKGSSSADDIIIGGPGAGNFWGSHGITVANGGGVAVYVTGAGAGFVSQGTVSLGQSHYTMNELGSGTGGRYFITAGNATGTAYKVETNGTVYSDAGTAMTTPADYAEMFEWADGNPDGQDRVGMSVTLVGDKIKVAEEGDVPIGIVSGNPAVLGDAGDLRWVDQFLRDEFNRPVLASGERCLNPAYDPNHKYVPRRERKEWSAVGLVGKLRLRNGQVVNPAWRRMRDISPNVAEYLVGV